MSATLTPTPPGAGVGPRSTGELGSADRTFAGGGALIGCQALGCSTVFVQSTATNRYCSEECKKATAADKQRAARGTVLDLSDGDRLEHLHVDLGHTVRQIADMAGVSRETVRRALRAHGIESWDPRIKDRAIRDLLRRRRFDDRNNPPAAALVAHRIRGVKDALIAVVEEQDDEDPVPVGIRPRTNTFPLRDALIDLAAACLDYADQLPAPNNRLGDPL